jgi:hypothetical protein
VINTGVDCLRYFQEGFQNKYKGFIQKKPESILLDSQGLSKKLQVMRKNRDTLSSSRESQVPDTH